MQSNHTNTRYLSHSAWENKQAALKLYTHGNQLHFHQHKSKRIKYLKICHFKLDGLRSAPKVHFQKMLSDTLTLKPRPWKCYRGHLDILMSTVIVISSIKICFCISEKSQKMPPKVLICHQILCALAITSKSNQFIFVSNHTVLNFMKFQPQCMQCRRGL